MQSVGGQMRCIMGDVQVAYYEKQFHSEEIIFYAGIFNLYDW